MNYQQTLKIDGTIEPNSVIVISDSGDRRVVNSNASDPLWLAYLNWLAAGNRPLSPYTGPLSETIKSLSDKLDSRVATIYSTWSRFQQEYLLREQAATAYKAADYAGECSVWIAAFAAAAGITNVAATDKILAQAGSLNGALEQLGALRMRKYELLAAADETAAQATFEDILGKINGIAAAIQ
jgi:hypothetical protein